MNTGGAMAAATAAVTVDAPPADAFRTFTDEIELWWRPGTRYWNDPDRGVSVRLEPGVGGRFLEVYDPDTGAGYEVGRVTVWEPGRRLGLTWTQVGWPEDVSTDIEVTFEPLTAGAGTVVRLTHSGFERLGTEAEALLGGYAAGWQELLGWMAEATNERKE